MSNDKKDTESQDDDTDKGTVELAAGAGIGVYGTTLAITAGVVCPTCVVAAPALLGYGLYKRHKAKKDVATKPSLQTDKKSDS